MRRSVRQPREDALRPPVSELVMRLKRAAFCIDVCLSLMLCKPALLKEIYKYV